MKHAILILAHKDFSQLRHLIEYFVKDCYVYVHIDKKATITSEELHSIDSMPQVRAVYRKYKVHWGGFSILKTEMFLLRQVVKDGDCDYVHLISGQDYPIKPLDQFLCFFEENKGKEFIRYANIPNANWDHYTFFRFQYFFPYDYIDNSPKRREYIIKKSVKLQKFFGIQRRIPDYFEHLYGSTQWFSITIMAVKVLIDYTRKKPSFYRRCRWTFAPEEYYVATVLCNLIPKTSISPKDLRFIRWKYENDNYPANLSKNYFHVLIKQRDNVFARKLEYDKSAELIRLIDEYILKESSLNSKETGAWIYNGFHQYEYSEQLAQVIYQFCKYVNVDSVLDMGCGAGLYVSGLRNRGIPVTGYDANPYTPLLSSLILAENDEPCGIADLTDPLEAKEKFDIVMCMNTLSYIPPKYQDIALKNLAGLSQRYILLCENSYKDERNQEMMNSFEKSLNSLGLIKNEIGSLFLSQAVKRDNITILLFERNKL